MWESDVVPMGVLWSTNLNVNVLSELVLSTVTESIFIIWSKPISACWSWIVVVLDETCVSPPLKLTSLLNVNLPFLSTLKIWSNW